MNDYANEFVINTTASVHMNFTPHHAFVVESTYMYPACEFTHDPLLNMDPSDRTCDFRFFYAITTDEILGR